MYILLTIEFPKVQGFTLHFSWAIYNDQPAE